MPAAIEARLGRPLRDVFAFEVTAVLPGGGDTWSPRLGDGPVAMEAGSTAYDWPVLVLTAVAAVSLLALLVVLVVRGLRSRRA